MHEFEQIVAVCAVIVREDRVLGMRRARHKDAGAGLWETLSGRVSPGEEPLTAVAREIDEECGLSVRIDPRPVDAYAARRGQSPMVVIVYRADYLGGEVRLSEEHDAFAWLTAQELSRCTPFTRLVEAVERALWL
jgi:8-oxo-dGTP pyrophosphatase MutT (NUDIX family)